MDEQVRVLIADDSAFTRRMIRMGLERSEFCIVAEAGGGGEAIQKFHEQVPDVTVLDIIMPDKEGHEVLKEILRINPEARVIMLSSLGTEEMITTCLGLGAIGFVQKPFTRNVLLAQMRTAVAAHEPVAHS